MHATNCAPTGSEQQPGQPKTFLGSGLLFLAMMFVMTAVTVGLVASNTGVADPAAHAEVINFGKMVVLSAGKTYGLRMAAVFMVSLATIWLRTRLMPWWLVIVSYLAGLTLLVISEVSLWAIMAFPVWVLIVSVMILLGADQPKALSGDTGKADWSPSPPQRPDD